MDNFTKQLLKDFKMLLFDNVDISPCEICEHCKYENQCNNKCSQYQEGRGMYDHNNHYVDWKWTCMDWDFGTCSVLENTPCHNCWQTNFSNWKYDYKHKEIINE